MSAFLPDQQSNAIVRIFKANGQYAGTGFFVDAEGGILTTLYIVGKDKQFILIGSDNQTFNAVLEKSDGRAELALLRMSGGVQKSYLNINNISEPPLCEKVTILGYSGNALSMLAGTAAGTYSQDTLSPNKILIRVDTPPRGLSGAPAIDKNGDVIGILIAYLPERNSALTVAGATALAFIQTQEAL